MQLPEGKNNSRDQIFRKADVAGTGAATLDGYLQAANTQYFYCWDGSGNISFQDKTATACP